MKLLKLKPSIQNHPSRTKKSSLTALRGMMDAANFFKGYCPLLSPVNTKLFKHEENLFYNFDPFSNDIAKSTNEISPSVYAIIMDHLGTNIIKNPTDKPINNVNKDQNDSKKEHINNEQILLTDQLDAKTNDLNIEFKKDTQQEQQRNEMQQLTHETLRLHDTICSIVTDSTLTDSTSSTDDKLKHVGNQLLLWNIKNSNEQDIESESKSNDYCDMEEDFIQQFKIRERELIEKHEKDFNAKINDVKIEYKTKETELLNKEELLRDKIEQELRIQIKNEMEKEFDKHNLELEEKFESQLTTLQSQLNEAQTEIEEERKKNHELQTNMNDIQNENKQLLSELEHLRKKLSQQQKNHLNFVNGLRTSLAQIKPPIVHDTIYDDNQSCSYQPLVHGYCRFEVDIFIPNDVVLSVAAFYKKLCKSYSDNDSYTTVIRAIVPDININNIDSGNESDSESLSELATYININKNDSDNSDEKSNDILHFVPIANDNNIKIKLKERLCELDVGDQMLDVFAVKSIVNEELNEDIDALFENLNPGKDMFDSVDIDAIVNGIIASHDLKEKLIVTLNLQLNDEILMDDVKTIDDMELLHININDMKVNQPPSVPSWRYTD